MNDVGFKPEVLCLGLYPFKGVLASDYSHGGFIWVLHRCLSKYAWVAKHVASANNRYGLLRLGNYTIGVLASQECNMSKLDWHSAVQNKAGICTLDAQCLCNCIWIAGNKT